MKTAFRLSLAIFGFSATLVQAQFTYTTNYNGTLNVFRYNGSDAVVVIPSVDTNTGLTVASIGTGFCENSATLASITIPDTVVRIHPYAFDSCSALTNVSLGNGVTNFESEIFYGCTSLPSITFPNSLIGLGDHAFVSCTKLTNVVIGSGLTSIGDGSFSYCSALPGIVIPRNVTNIGSSAFDHCTRLESLSLPDTLLDISTNAFNDCKELPAVSIPDSVVTLCDGAFASCSGLTNVVVGAGVTRISDDAFSSDFHIISVSLPKSLTSIGEGAFSVCFNLPNITIPNGVTNIGDDAFGECSLLSTLTIPQSVQTIGDGAFSSCSGLTNVTISAGVTSIGGQAFDSDTSVPIFTIPASVTNIGFEAFALCANLARIDVDPGNLYYSSADGVLMDKGQTTIIQCPDGKTGSFTAPDSTTSIEEYAFSQCGLSNIVMGPCVTNIGEWALYYCAGLRSVYFKGNAPTVGENAFYNDWSFSVYYVAGTTGWDAFTSATGITPVLWQPQQEQPTIAGSAIKSDQFTFTINGPSSMVAVIEASTNLAKPNWVPVATNSLTGGSCNFGDSQWESYPVRFYRIKAQ